MSQTGWKLIHQDVFRPPGNILLFSSLIGMGAQLFVMTFLLLSLALLGLFAPTKRGSVASASIILYALTSGVGGYVSARLYKQLKGTQWVWNTVVTALSFPLPLTVTFGFLNTTAIVSTLRTCKERGHENSNASVVVRASLVSEVFVLIFCFTN